jgi:cardiolipin synthase A/B
MDPNLMPILHRLPLIPFLNSTTSRWRDYAVTTTKKSEVKEMIRCFDADWARKPFKPDPKSHLLWCPNNGRERIAAIIDGAKKSLWLQNERYQDTVIVERLVRAVNRGVRVKIMARAPHKLSGKKLAEGIGGLRIMHDVGAKVHLLRHLKLHGKIVIADGKRAIVGSINLSPGSFDSRRELAIETKSKRVLKRLVQVSRRDWKHSQRIDLSDAGILADLEKHGSKDANVLALGQ